MLTYIYPYLDFKFLLFAMKSEPINDIFTNKSDSNSHTKVHLKCLCWKQHLLLLAFL